MTQVNIHLDKGCQVQFSQSNKTPFFNNNKREQNDQVSNEKTQTNGSNGSNEVKTKSPSPTKLVSMNAVLGKRPPPNNSQQIGSNKRTTTTNSDSISKPTNGSNNNSNKPPPRKPTTSQQPLANLVRPQTLDDYIGQQDLVGPQGILRKFIESDTCPSMILWGPSGVGKTTLARIIAHKTNNRFVELSATVNSIQDCKKIFEEARNEKKLMKRGTILFMDEVHRFNKAQQDVFLPFVEKGDVTLIGATTENPSFKLNSALISRCRVFVLQKLSIEDIKKMMKRTINILNSKLVKEEEEEKVEEEKKEEKEEVKTEEEKDKVEKSSSIQPMINLTDEVITYLAGLADGDGRVALNILEMVINLSKSNNNDNNKKEPLTLLQVKNGLQRTHMLYDRAGDGHYDTISAFHKSIRGSDPDATLYYLGRMLAGGEDPLYVARRMIRIASEDVGLADESCLPFAIATCQTVQQLGMPECDMALAHCAVKLATAPKSVMVYRAFNKVKAMMKQEPEFAAKEIPLHIRNAPTRLMAELGYGKKYKYNPDFVDGKVKQQYMPAGLENVKFIDFKNHLGTLTDPEL